MKTKIIFFVVLVLIIGITSAFISMKTIFYEDIGPHGGQLQKAENYNIEVKREYSHFYVYLLDSKNKTISSKNISCEIRFSLYDGTYLDLPLKPHAADGFIIDYFSSDYNYYRITFQVEGKSVIAKFENENILVKGNLEYSLVIGAFKQNSNR